MKIGVRAHDFGRSEPEILAEAIAGAGFQTTQLALTKAVANVSSLSDVTGEMLCGVRRAFEDSKVEIGVLGCYIEPSYSDKDARLLEVKKFLTGLEYAKELGVNLVGTETTHFDPDPSNEPLRESAYQNLKDSVLRMVERAETLGVNIGIEAVANHTLNTAVLTRRLLDEVNSRRLRVIFDPVNLILTEADIEGQDKLFADFLGAVGDKISALHVKDIVFENGAKVWRNIGNGNINYPPIFEWLCRNNANLPVLREEVEPKSAETDIMAMRQIIFHR